MTDKKKQSDHADHGKKLSDDEAAQVAGGMAIGGGAAAGIGGKNAAPPSCIASEDTGMMGCPG